MLKVVSVDEALEIIKNAFPQKITGERVNVTESVGRVLCEDVYSEEFIPAFDRSVMDGFALRARDTSGAGENMPSMLKIKGEVLMGETPSESISEGECMKISTGGMIPSGADSVIMSEYTDEGFEGMCLCLKGVSQGENVSKKGEDVKSGDKVLSSGTLISSSHTGVLCALGKTEIMCAKRPVAGIISTGDEIVPVSEKPGYGKVRDINSVLTASLLREHGCDTRCYGIVKDDKKALTEIFERALSECDFVVLSGGSSKGARDMTAEIISEKGELLFHGLSLKPGKPTIFGKCNNKAVFGLPGHPSAAYYVAIRIILPFIGLMTGGDIRLKSHSYPLGVDIPSNHGREEMVSVKITDGKIYPVYGKSGLVSLLSESQGFIIIERNREGNFLGEEREVYFTK